LHDVAALMRQMEWFTTRTADACGSCSFYMFSVLACVSEKILSVPKKYADNAGIYNLFL
jgi:hypothetical protein